MFKLDVEARASLIPLQTIAEYLWNSAAYDADRAKRKALLDQYGKGASELLAVYLKAYGDYWWQDNIRPYIKNDQVFLCPSANPHVTATDGRPPGTLNPLVRDYIANEAKVGPNDGQWPPSRTIAL